MLHRGPVLRREKTEPDGHRVAEPIDASSHFAACAASCGLSGSGPKTGAPSAPDIQVLSAAIATAARYLPDLVELSAAKFDCEFRSLRRNWHRIRNTHAAGRTVLRSLTRVWQAPPLVAGPPKDAVGFREGPKQRFFSTSPGGMHARLNMQADASAIVRL